MIFNAVLKQNWIFKKYNNNKVLEISEKFSLKEITSRLLTIRNINIDDVELFLNPTIKNTMPNPYLINDMENAVLRIVSLIVKKQNIGIFGDYDVDGASSTALLAKYFQSINQEFNIYIPDRRKDGYGPNINAFKHLIQKGAKSIITVDCGTSSYDAIEYAQKNKIDVVVLDHHQSNINLPQAHAIVNPNRLDDKSNLNYLCAAGVTFMFLTALNKNLREKNWFKDNNIIEPNILNLLDLVCLGTVCDLVPLVGLNRAIVNQGLKIIKNRSNLGIKTLYDLCNIKTKPSTYHIGYQLGPRINAGGRVGKSSYGAELLISEDSINTYKLAKDLNEFNNQRRNLEIELMDKVEKEAQTFKNDPVLILSNDNWHQGIIGIVAARIKEKYYKPTFLISFNGDNGVGSARSIYGFDIGTAIISAVQSGILERGGGHKMAGGFSIKKDKFLSFKEFIIKKFEKVFLDEHKKNNLFLDSFISPSALNEQFFEEIQLLSPFGPGNSEPIFVLENLKVLKSTIVASKHIKTIFIGKNEEVVKSIAFNSVGTGLESHLTKNNNKKIHVAGKLSINDWEGKKNIELIIQDIALA